VAEEYGAENVIVLLGSPDPDSTEIFAETVVNGDPTFAGPLTGANLHLAVLHVLEPDVKSKAEPSVYEHEVGLMAGVLDTDRIVEVVRRVRENARKQ
jgi:betaine reductase